MRLDRCLARRTRLGTLLFAALLVGWVGPAAAQEEDEEEPSLEERLRELEPPERAVDPGDVPPGSGPLVLTPGRSYAAGGLHRFLFGDLNRPLWDIAFEIDVLDLSKVGGGLTPTELSGGQQTVGMRFAGANGRTYQFRSIVKTPSRALPRALRISPVDDVVQDQMAAQFPLGAMVVAELLQAEGILVARPRPVVMPDDPRLGPFREKFAGLMGWIEERPNELEGDRPGFAGSDKITGTEALYENIEEDPRHYVNAEEFLRARLIDMFVGDWDRHNDQWRWASFEESGRVRWDPIPRDRDWALSRIDGVLPSFGSQFLPQYRASWDEYPDVFNLHWNAQFLDRRLLAPLPREAHERIAADLAGSLSDDVIERAVGVLPQAYRDAYGDVLVAHLRHRRDELPRVSAEFYELIARWADVTTTNADEVATVTGQPDGRVRVEVRSAGDAGILVFSRTFVPEETKEIRLYLLGGDDVVQFEGPGFGSIRLRVIGGKGDDAFVDATTGRGVHVYDDDGQNRFELGPDGWYDESEYDDPEGPQDIDVIFEARDWGASWVWMPLLSFDPDLGFFAGAGLTRFGYGFRRDPWNSRFSVRALAGAELGESRGGMEWVKTLTDGGLRFGADFSWETETNTRFFGVGNETPSDLESTYFRAPRSSVALGLRLESAQDQAVRAFAGPVVRFAGRVDRDANIFADLDPYGSDDFAQAGGVAGLELGRIDEAGLSATSAAMELTGRAFPAVLDVEEAFGSARAVGRLVVAANEAPFKPGLHLRASGEKVWGSLIPFDEFAALGGAASLPGYRERRFAGTEAASGSALGRIHLFRMRPFATIDVGIHGIATVGRVWNDGEDSDEWHTGFGGGIWLMPRIVGRPIALTLVRGDDTSRFYFALGFPF